MEPIPGSATEEKAGELAGIEALNTTYPIGNGWGSSRRWDAYGGEQPPMTPKRTAAIADKRACVVLVKRDDGTLESLGGGDGGGASKTHKKPKNWLAEFAFGAELLAGYASGSLFAYPIRNRRGKEYVPTQAKWKLRSPHVSVVEVIAGAMIGLKKRGVVISHGELAKLVTSCGRSVIGLQERQLGTVVRELCAWGLLRRTPVAVARGKATSFRANAYQLTTLAAGVYRLKLPAACGELPDPVLRDLPVAKTEPTGSGPIRQELPGNPETPLRGKSPEEHAALHRIDQGAQHDAHTVPRAESARGPAGVAAPCVHRTPAPCPTNPRRLLNLESSTRTDALSDGSMSREVQAPLLCPTDGASANDELELAERRVGDAAGQVLRGEVDWDREERYVEGDPRETTRRLKLARARLVAQEKADLKQRAAAQQDRVRERENARRNSGGGKAVLDRDDERAPGNGVIDPEIAEVIRKHHESMRDEPRYNLQPPTKPRYGKDEDVDLAETVERAWASSPFGVPTVTAEKHLAKIRGGKS